MSNDRTYFETVRTGSNRVAFKRIFFALSRQSGCPDLATKKYFNLLEKGFLSEGVGFLKKLSAFPIFGLRVLGNDTPRKSSYRVKVRSRTGTPYLFAWYFQELAKVRNLEPTPENVLKIRRILTVLSIGKMLSFTCPSRIKKERLAYASNSVKRLNPQRIAQFRDKHKKEIQEFLKFVRFRGRDDTRLRKGHSLNPVEGSVYLDPECYSLKSLSKRKLNRSLLHEVPEAVSTNLMKRSILDITKGLQPRATALAMRTVPNGKQTIISEYGGKHRGITSYFSPLIHAATTYNTIRTVLNGWIPDCSLDQQVGHARIRELTLQSNERLDIISADATAFTDSIDIDLAHVMLECIGEDGFLEYIYDISIATDNGIISTSLPLMGIKGCFELGCIMLAYGLFRERNKRYGIRRRRMLVLKGSAHCCDDFCGRASLEAVKQAYNFIGCDLNYNKTVCSKSAAVFCGEMYWKGACVTPVRLKITDLLCSNSGTVVLPSVRDFLDRCRPVYGPSAMRVINGYIRAACIRAVGAHNVNFQLPTRLGGVPLIRKSGIGLLEILSKKRNLLYALYNTPIVKDERDTLSAMIGLVRLGKPAKQPDGTILPAISLPTIGRNGWLKRKIFVKDMVECGSLSVNDVLEYYYS